MRSDWRLTDHELEAIEVAGVLLSELCENRKAKTDGSRYYQMWLDYAAAMGKIYDHQGEDSPIAD